MENWLLMQIFHHGLTNSTCENMDAATGGASLSLTILGATVSSHREDGLQPRLE
jgi:hypothetical protein